MKKVRSGEPLHIPARNDNAFDDAALDHQQRSLNTDLSFASCSTSWDSNPQSGSVCG